MLDDPYHVAQQFILQHQLPQDHLDTIADFIINNTRPVTLGQPPAGNPDPYTGGSSYQTASAQVISHQHAHSVTH